MIQLLFLSFVFASDDFPANVKKVFDAKCNICHGSTLSQSLIKDEESKKYFEKNVKKAQRKFISDKYPFVSKDSMDEIRKETVKEVSRGKMPPKKFVEKYPEHSLTEAEKELIINWAKSQ